MEEFIRKDIKNNLYTKLQDRYNVSNLKELNGYQNWIGEGNIDNKNYKLLISHASHRNKIELEAEIRLMFVWLENFK